MIRRIAAVVVVACCAAGCDIDLGRETAPTTAITSTTVAAAPVQWVAETPGQAMYLRWEGSAEGIVGVAKIAVRSEAGEITTTTDELTGVSSGSQVVLTVAGQTWSGTIAGDELVLDRPLPDGSRTLLTLRRATVTEFDAAVAAMSPTTTTAAPAPSSTTSPTTTTVAPRPPTTTQPAASAEVLRAAMEEAAASLRAMSATIAGDAVEWALDGVYAAEAVFWASADTCATASPAFDQLQAASGTLRAEANALAGAIDELATRRQRTYDAAIAYTDATGAGAGEAGAALGEADRLIDGFGAYVSDVRSADAAVMDAARGGLASVC